jgi:DNA (cytosine-5)-methyltransferase 1
VNVDPAAINVLSLFSGAGGLDLGVRLAIPGARTVCYVEREAYPCAVLAARMEDGGLDPAPIWTDVTTFDGRPWRGIVDCIIGGWPCQDISVAGKGGGVAEGKRSGLWREFARIIREVGPCIVMLENVAALVNRGLDIVVGDLADLGYAAEWDVFGADEVGAPHQRDRLFLLAYTDGAELRQQSGRRSGPNRADSIQPRQPRAQMANAHDNGRKEPGLLIHARQSPDAVFDVSGSSDGFWPPGPEDADGWQHWKGPQPSVCRSADGMAEELVTRIERLRICGNGVVPQQAAYALRCLMARV